LFTDVVGSTAWRARLGDAAADEREAEFERASRDVVTAEGGGVVKGLGDGVMAEFRSAIAALDAATALQRVAQQLRIGGEASRLRVGISSGDMVREGDDWHGTAAIEAARLCAEASGGQVLVSDSAIHLTRGRSSHTIIPVGLRALRGLESAIAVYELAWGEDRMPSLPPALQRSAAAPMVGRTREIGLGETFLDAVARGGSNALLVVGEPGIGKTRLAAAIGHAGVLHDFTVFHGHCEEGTSAPHQPIVEALSPWLEACPGAALARILGDGGGELVRLWPELPQRVPSLPPPSAGEPETQRWRLMEAVTRFIATIAADHPVLLVVDDLQWAEPATVALLRHVGDAELERVGLVMTVRSGEVQGEGGSVSRQFTTIPGLRTLTLGGLTEAEVADLVELRTGRRPTDRLSLRLKHHTDGNPFFLDALLAHLDELDVLRQPGDGGLTDEQLERAGVPEGVRTVVERRLDRLGPVERQILDAGAVAGDVFEAATIGAVVGLGLDDTIEALEGPIRAGLIREQGAGRLAFAHSLVRHTAISSLSLTRLARLHWRFAEEIERMADADASRLGEVAYHYAAGLDVGDIATVVRSAVGAGDDAVNRVAFEEAAHHFRVALDLLHRMPADSGLRYRVLTSLGDTLNCLAAPDEAQPYWLEAADLAVKRHDPEALFRALFGYAYLFQLTPDTSVNPLFDDLLDLLPPGDSPLRARALAWKCVHESHDRRLMAEAVAMAHRTGDVDAVMASLDSAFWVEARGPDAVAMLRVAEQLNGLVRADGGYRPRSSWWGLRDLAWSLLRLGRRPEVDRTLADYHKQARESGQGMAINNCLLLQAAIATAEGRFVDSKRLAAEASHHGGRHNTVIALAYGAQILAARMEQGRVGDVLASLSQMDAVLNDIPAWRTMLAGALADAGEHEQAAVQLDGLLSGGESAIPHDATAPLAVRYLPELCRQLGHRVGAAMLLPRITPWAGQLLVVTHGLSIEGASDRSIGHLLATVGRFDEADDAYRSAADLERSARFAPLAARTEYWHARALIERNAPGDRPKATALLTEVVAVTSRSGMQLLNEQATALLKTY
jgi:tetratricopeptide (TPR) repeat protein